MAVELNHTIIQPADKCSAKFLANIPGLEPGPGWAHSVPIRRANGAPLDASRRSSIHRPRGSDARGKRLKPLLWWTAPTVSAVPDCGRRNRSKGEPSDDDHQDRVG
jgi:hypothetical protein